MNRRKAIKKIGLSFGSMTLTPSLVSLFQSCKSETDWTPRFFSSDQLEIVSKFLEIIIPETKDIPGAAELKLIRYIDAFATLAKEKETRGIKNLDILVSNTLDSGSKSSLNKLTTEDYENQLKKYLLAGDNKIDQWTDSYNKFWLEDRNGKEIPEEALVYFSIRTIREWAVSAYRYNNEYIAKNVLDYRPIPGEHKGCVDLQEATGGLVWAVQ